MKLSYIVIFSVLFSVFLPAKAQSFFPDSAYYFGYVDNIRLGTDISVDYVKDQIFLDSITSKGEYYSVVVDPNYSDRGYKNYQLRVKDSQVFFTGNLYLDNDPTVAWLKEDLIIYDYALNQGDTFHLIVDSATYNYRLIIDSVKYEAMEDGAVRKVQYHSNNLGSYGNGAMIAGIGGVWGLTPFGPRYVNYHGLISVCKSGTLMYRNESFIHLWEERLEDKGKDFGSTILANSCEEDSLKEMVNKIQLLSNSLVEQSSLKLYPNPAGNQLHIEGISEADYSVLNGKGQLIEKGNFSHFISTRNLPKGVYFLRIKTEAKVFAARFIK